MDGTPTDVADPGSLPRSDSPLHEDGVLRHVHRALPHDSARKHVEGLEQYVDDIREPEGTLHVAIGQSPQARGRLVALDVSAVRAAERLAAARPG